MPIFRFCPDPNASKLFLATGWVWFLVGMAAAPSLSAGNHAFSSNGTVVSHFPEPPPSQQSARPEPSKPESKPRVDPAKTALVEALHRRDRYGAARKMIRTELKQAGGTVERFWRNRLAENYRMDGRFLEAASTWEELIETHSGGPVATWKLQQARAYRSAGRPGEAEILLLRIRYEHPRSTTWLDAMLELARISLDRGRLQEARRLLSTTSQRFPPRNHPSLAYELARIYDRYPSIRDFSRAVWFYQMVASRHAPGPAQARQADRRAHHLTRAYLQFGVE